MPPDGPTRRVDAVPPARPARGARRRRARHRGWTTAAATDPEYAAPTPHRPQGPEGERLTAPFVDQIGDQSRPPGLMVRAKPGAVVAVKVLIEKQQIAPVGIG